MISVKQLTRNVSASILYKVGAIFVGVVSVPAYIEYFDNQSQLGIWFTFLSVINWIIFFDLGLGNGLKNELIAKISEREYTIAKRMIKDTYFCLSAFISILFLLVSVFYYLDVLGFLVPKEMQLYSTAAMILLCFVILQFPLRLIISILLALQKSAFAALIPLVTQSMVLIYLVLFSSLSEDQKMVSLAVAYGLAIVLPLLASSIIVFCHISRYWTSSSCKNHQINGVGIKILLSGSRFFLVQVLLLLVNGTNEYFILSYVEAESVVNYQVLYRVFSVFLVVFSTVSIPLWSAIAQAKELCDFKRIRLLNNVLGCVVLVLAVGIVLINPLFSWLIELWLGENSIEVSAYEVGVFSTYIFSLVVINYSACICNGFNKLKPQISGLIIATIMKFGLIAFAPELVNSWADIVIITIIALLPAVVMQLWSVKRLMNYNDLMKLSKNEVSLG